MKKSNLNKNVLTKNNFFWFIFVITLVKTFLFSNLGFGLLDEGESLHNASRILQGSLPYKDFFAIFPPIDNYFFATIFQFFGKSIIWPRLVMSIIFSFTPAFMFLLISKYSNNLIALIPPVLLIFLDLNIERLYFFTPVLISLYFMDINLLYSGLLLGIASLVRFDIPGTFLIGIVFTTIIKNYKNLKKTVKSVLVLFLGYLAPVLILIFWMKEKNIIGLFIKSAFVDSVLITKLHDLPNPSFLNIFPKNLSLSSLSSSYLSFYFYAIVFIYFLFALGILISWKSISKKDYWVIGLFVSALLSMFYVLGRTDIGHIVKGTMTALFLAPYLLKLFNFPYKLLQLFLLVVVLVSFLASLSQSFWWIQYNNTKIQIGNFNLRINSNSPENSTLPSADTLRNSVLYLSDTKTDEKVLALPYHAGLYFLADRNPPSIFNNLLAGFISTQEGQYEFIRSIEENNVRKIVYARDSGPKMMKSKLFEYNPLIDQYIMNNFKIKEKSWEGWLFMEKK